MQIKAILLGINQNNDIFAYEMEELKNLCDACGIEVCDTITQNADSQHPRSYVGKGKLDEVKMTIEHYEATHVVCNDELSPSQIKHLEETLQVMIFDRTYIILEIFKSRATTKEAKLQVDIASLRYMLPRLIGLREGLSRQRGVGRGGVGRGRGQGETSLELDRRNISDRIALLKRELKKLTAERALQRKQRTKKSIPVVSLVGYTNSGKSSTLNAIMIHSTNTQKQVLQKDMLFATLETASRKIKLPNNHEFILTDTVGFVSKLPHHLVEAFKSTLEEIKESQLIIHVVDAANPDYEKQIEITNQTLKEIGVIDIPMLYAFNKIDLLEGYVYIPSYCDNAVRISATKPDNINRLIATIEQELFFEDKTFTLHIPYEQSIIVHMLKENAEVIELDYLDTHIAIKAKLNPQLATEYAIYIINGNGKTI